jgi:hypothetical protein
MVVRHFFIIIVPKQTLFSLYVYSFFIIEHYNLCLCLHLNHVHVVDLLSIRINSEFIIDNSQGRSDWTNTSRLRAFSENYATRIL